MPKWLADYRTGDNVAFSDFMSGQSVIIQVHTLMDAL